MFLPSYRRRIVVQVVLVVLAVVIIFRSLSLSRSGLIHRGLVSGISAMVYLLAMWIPAHLQAAGITVSKLAGVGLAQPPTYDEIGRLSVRWVIELALIVAGEWCVVSLGLGGRGRRRIESYNSSTRRAERVAWILLTIGAVSTLAFPVPALEDRAQGGGGPETLMRTFLITGLCFVAYSNFFEKTVFKIALIVGAGFLILEGIRSPLLVISISYFAGLIVRNRIGPKAILGLALLGIVFAVGAAIMSSSRANIIRQYSLSFSNIVGETLNNPWAAIYHSGLDTLDGYRLAQIVSPYEPAQPLSPLTMLTNFVPRFAWPSKPQDLTVTISAKYLRYGASGQFLSPVGYLTIAFGGYIQAIVALFGISATFTYFVIRYRHSFILSIVICIIVRFMIGGSPFDIYYGGTLLIPLIVADKLSKVFHGARIWARTN